MDFDPVEIVMAWEEALGVTLTDAECEGLRTPRAAVDLIAAKLNATDGRRGCCLTLRAFNRVRHGLVSGAAVRRSEVTPDAKLRDLLPRPQRQRRWQAAQAASGLPALPSLGWGFGLLLAPTTVADVARWIVCSYPKSLKSANEPWTRNEIRTVVRTVVTEQSGVTNFSDDDDFIYDLGLG
jgi:hypothetical protein